MNRIEQTSIVAMTNSTPLFASSLLALFYVLRKSFNERRSQARDGDK